MEIKDLGTTLELGCEMAEVRGGGRRTKVGNIDISDIWSYNESSISNGDVDADTYVRGQRSSGSSFSDIGAVVTYAPVNTVTQTSGIALDLVSRFKGLNF